MGGRIVVSLDFELRWGVYDVLGDDPSRYRRHLEGVREVVPRLLERFERLGVPATWATVGAVACEGWDEFEARAPACPPYDDPRLRRTSAYRAVDPDGRLHFAPELVAMVRAARGQELGSHTFAHVYLREPGVRRQDAEADADAVVRLFADRWGEVPRSFVFPRNQVAFTDVLAARGIRVWRTNPRPFWWAEGSAASRSRLGRALRLVDALGPLGRRARPEAEHRASHFLRLALPGPAWRLHARRIARDAARMRPGEVLHLWAHPHNLGDDPALRVARFGEVLERALAAAPAGTTFAPMGALA
jgi:peptidoglycan/xylan/chitin deacetylase (PgdA/CDA1 family)